MAKARKKTKAEELQEAVAEAVGAGRELHLLEGTGVRGQAKKFDDLYTGLPVSVKNRTS